MVSTDLVAGRRPRGRRDVAGQHGAEDAGEVSGGLIRITSPGWGPFSSTFEPWSLPDPLTHIRPGFR